MKDLSTYYLANFSVIEEIISEGPPYTLLTYQAQKLSSVDPVTNEPTFSVTEFSGETQFIAIPALSEFATEVYLGKTKLSLQKSEGPLLEGKYRILVGAGPNGEDVIEIYTPLDDTLKIYAVSISDESKAKLTILGKQFLPRSEFRLGGKRIENFSVLSSTKAEAIVDEKDLTPQNIENAKITAPVDVVTNEAGIIFDLSTRSKAARNHEVLIQRFLTLLMDDRAGRLHSLLPKGKFMTGALKASIVSRLSASVRVTSTIIQKTTPSDASPSEVLVSAQIGEVTIDEETGTVSAVVNINTKAGTVGVPINL